jgi:hypothetical protein
MSCEVLVDEKVQVVYQDRHARKQVLIFARLLYKKSGACRILIAVEENVMPYITAAPASAWSPNDGTSSTPRQAGNIRGLAKYTYNFLSCHKPWPWYSSCHIEAAWIIFEKCLERGGCHLYLWSICCRILFVGRCHVNTMSH